MKTTSIRGVVACICFCCNRNIQVCLQGCSWMVGDPKLGLCSFLNFCLSGLIPFFSIFCFGNLSSSLASLVNCMSRVCWREYARQLQRQSKKKELLSEQPHHCPSFFQWNLGVSGNFLTHPEPMTQYHLRHTRLDQVVSLPQRPLLAPQHF